MTDLRSKIRDKMRTLTLATVATVTADGKPWSRYVVVRGDENLTIWFATFKGSRKTQHIRHSQEVHLNLGVTDMQSAASWLQVQGRARILEDAETKRAVWYSMLEPIFNGPGDPNYVVCQVTPYRIEYYTMNQRHPEVWEA